MSEKILLGQILLDNSIYSSMVATEDDFEQIKNKQILRGIGKCLDSDLVADIVTVSSIDHSINHIYLANLTTDIASTKNWKFYENDILYKSRVCKLKTLSNQFKDWIGTETPEQVISNMENALMEINTGKNKAQIQTIQEISKYFLDVTEKKFINKDNNGTIPTGIEELDNKIIGFRRRMYYLIGARPSQGKSAMLMNMACSVGIDQGKRVGYISTESSNLEIATRIFASQGSIDSLKIIKAYLTTDELARMNHAVDTISNKQMYFYYTPGMELDDLIRQAKRLVKVNKCEILFVDYLQDIVIKGQEHNLEKTKQKSKAMKILAEELNIPVVVAAQLKRDSEGRRPLLSDFSDSSQLEKDADGGFLLFHHVKNKKEVSEGKENPKYDTYLLVEKARDGITGAIRLFFNKQFVRFEELNTDAKEFKW